MDCPKGARIGIREGRVKKRRGKWYENGWDGGWGNDWGGEGRVGAGGRLVRLGTPYLGGCT